VHKLVAFIGDKLSKIRHFALKLQLDLDLAIPTLLIPQKSDSPSLLVLNLGNIVANYILVTLNNKIDLFYRSAEGGEFF
jgi:hypothetical protein